MVKRFQGRKFYCEYTLKIDNIEFYCINHCLGPIRNFQFIQYVADMSFYSFFTHKECFADFFIRLAFDDSIENGPNNNVIANNDSARVANARMALLTLAFTQPIHARSGKKREKKSKRNKVAPSHTRASCTCHCFVAMPSKFDLAQIISNLWL